MQTIISSKIALNPKVHFAYDIQMIPYKGYEEIQLPFKIGSFRPGYSTLEHLKGLYLKLYVSSADRSLRGDAAFGPLLEGPPGHAHGGTVAYVLDEAMGTASWCAGHKSVARRLNYELLKMAPLNETLEVWAGVSSHNEDDVYAWAELRNTQGEVLTRSEGLFHKLTDKQIEALRQKLLKKD